MQAEGLIVACVSFAIFMRFMFKGLKNNYLLKTGASYAKKVKGTTGNKYFGLKN